MTTFSFVSDFPQIDDTRFYQVIEVAAILNVSSDTVIRRFRDEPGVLPFTTGRIQKNGSAAKTSRLIPGHVIRRVLRRTAIV